MIVSKSYTIQWEEYLKKSDLEYEPYCPTVLNHNFLLYIV